MPGAYTAAGWEKIKPAFEPGNNAHLVIEPWVVGTTMVTADATRNSADRLRDMYFQALRAGLVHVPRGLGRPGAQGHRDGHRRASCDLRNATAPTRRLFRTVTDNATLDMEPPTLIGKALEKGKDMAAGAADKLMGKDGGSPDRQVSPVERHFKPLIRFSNGDPATPGDADHSALNQYLTQVNNLAALLNRLDQSKAEPTVEFQAELARTSAFVDTLTGNLDASTRIILEPYLMNPIRGSRAGVASSGNSALSENGSSKSGKLGTPSLPDATLSSTWPTRPRSPS